MLGADWLMRHRMGWETLPGPPNESVSPSLNLPTDLNALNQFATQTATSNYSIHLNYVHPVIGSKRGHVRFTQSNYDHQMSSKVINIAFPPEPLLTAPNSPPERERASASSPSCITPSTPKAKKAGGVKKLSGGVKKVGGWAKKQARKVLALKET